MLDRALLAGRRIVASISGGKDSAAMSLFLTEHGIEHDRVFLDTGWEHDLTYDYLRGELPRVIGPITWVRGVRTMEEWILHKGMFPSRRIRWCTDELKIQPMRAHIRGLQDAGEDVVNVVGVRAAESESRSRLTEWDHQDAFDCDVWRPILSWSTDDVIATHRRHGLSPNPLYLRGAGRVGCWPCINSRKSEIRLIAETDPQRIVRLRVLEEQVTTLAEARAISTGTTLRNKPGWFQAPLGRTGECWPIDRVVEWSKTVRGGTEEDLQELLFSSMNDECMRWGMCETVTGTSDA